MPRTIQAKRLVNTSDWDWDKQETWDKWMSFRNQGIGSSEASIAMGINPWSDRLTLWLEKKGRLKKEHSEATRKRLELGREFEPAIADFFAKKYPIYRVERRNCIYQHPETPWAMCNVDRVLYDINLDSWGILEIKFIGEYARHSEEWKDQIPDYYYSQVQHAMYVTGLDWGFLFAVISNQDYQRVKVPRDEKFIAEMIALEAEFWSMLQTEVEPPATYLSGDAIEQVYPNSNSENIDLTEHKDYFAKLKAVKESLSELKIEAEDLENKIKQLLGSNSVGIVDGKNAVTWNTIKGRVSVDTAKLKTEWPDVYDVVKTVSEGSRTFRFNYKGE